MKSHRKGLTLSKIVVAIGVLAMAALTMTSAFLGGYRLMAQSTNLSSANEIGQEFLETVKSRRFDQTTVGVFDGKVPTPQDSTTLFPPSPYPGGQRNGQDYQLEVECTQYSDTTRLTKVKMTWGDIHSTELATMVHR